MRFGTAAWGFRETPLEKQLKITREMGLNLLELSIANYPKDPLQENSTDEEIAAVRRLYAKYGISTECGCTGNDFTGDDIPGQIAHIKAALDVAAKAGVKRIRIFAGFASDSCVYGETLAKMLDALSEVREYADKLGLILCVETHGGVAAVGDAVVHSNSATTRVDIWKKILATGVKMNYDPANLGAVGCPDPVAFYQMFKNDVKYVHLKDFKDVPGGVLPCRCGEGRLDWAAVMNALKDYDGPALFEYEVMDDVEAGMKDSYAFVKTLL